MNEKEQLVEDICKSILCFVSTADFTDLEKVAIARRILNLIENGERETEQ